MGRDATARQCAVWSSLWSGLPMTRRQRRALKGFEYSDAQYRKLGEITTPFVVSLSDLSVLWSWVATPGEWRLQGVRDRCGHFCGQTREGGWYDKHD